MANRAEVLREAAEAVRKVGVAHRNCEYGDEMTMREVRDGIDNAADVLDNMALDAEEAAGA